MTPSAAATSAWSHVWDPLAYFVDDLLDRAIAPGRVVGIDSDRTDSFVEWCAPDSLAGEPRAGAHEVRLVPGPVRSVELAIVLGDPTSQCLRLRAEPDHGPRSIEDPSVAGVKDRPCRDTDHGSRVGANPESQGSGLGSSNRGRASDAEQLACRLPGHHDNQLVVVNISAPTCVGQPHSDRRLAGRHHPHQEDRWRGRRDLVAIRH